MKKLFGIAIALTFCVSSYAAEIKTTILQELSPFEPFAGHTFHAGHLWVPSNRNELGSAYQLTVYGPGGNKVAEKALTHSMRYIYPYGTDSVLTVGVAADDQLTHYSVITLKNAKLTVQAWKVPLGAYATEWAGKPGFNYFTDPGGYDDGAPIGTLPRTLFTFNGGKYQYLPTRMSGPHFPIFTQNKLFVIGYPSVVAGRYINKIIPNQEKPVRLHTGTGLANLITLANGKLLAAADRGANEIVIIDVATEKVVKQFKVAAGVPRGLTTLKNCLVVGSEVSKKVSFYHLSDYRMVAEWDLSAVGNKLYGIRDVAADSVSGRVYVRSAYATMPGDPVKERNSTVMAEDSGEIKTLCQ